MEKSEYIALANKLAGIQQDLIGERIAFVNFTPDMDGELCMTLETEYIKIYIEVNNCCCGGVICEIDNKK